MELRMNFVTFVKLKDIIKVNDINGEIVDYEVVDNEIKGKFGINGKYYKLDLDKVNNFNDEIDFNIILLEEQFEIEDIDCIDLDYNVIEGRGIEITFDIKVEYSKYQEVVEDTYLLDDETVESNELSNETIYDDNKNTQNVNIESIKNEITKEIDMKMTNTLLYKEDNLPQEKNLIDLKDIKRTTIKVFYFKNDNELEELCKNNNVAIDKVFKSNINNDINKYRRVILR